MAMKGKAPPVPPLILAEGEYFVTCPYDISHQIINDRMMTHLIKCRRNHSRKMDKEGEPIMMLTCKYNWLHQVHSPEIQYHEQNCPDQYNIVQHIVGYVDRTTGKQMTELYMTKGHPNVFTQFKQAAKPKATTGEIIALEGQCQGDQYLLPQTDDASKTEEKTAPESSVNPMDNYSEYAQQALTFDDEEDWGKEAERLGTQSYDPRLKMEQMIQTKYPPNLTKSERKAWKLVNMQKAKQLLRLRDDDYDNLF